ncbi:MAG: hypothetical protein ACFFCG_03685 [Promethearchaeota archaeon]
MKIGNIKKLKKYEKVKDRMVDMKKKDFLIIGAPYLGFNLLLFLMYLINIEALLLHQGSYFSYILENFGINSLYFFNLFVYYLYPFGFLFILISCFYLYRLKVRKIIIFGIFGNIIYGLTITYFIFIFLYDILFLETLFIDLFWIITLIVNILVYIFLRSKKKDLTFEEMFEIKKVVLDLGTKFTRLEVREISETCGYDSDSIIGVLNSMIMNKEIYADFFKSTNTVSFDQQANIDEIDELMAVFKDWEVSHYEKHNIQEE